ncbi:HNH endonuclease [Thalassococcus sp. S3]|uniref:HNH endonuclease n=1 Tax=Thalassococcus sp. S3 TaxID=2017482 RepID=UPI00102413CD|nr:HNH endonuclease signature motif containing protein [Thalassococcus sp. S3]QBF32172.1 hypothetical protein CFI11_13220 [Thalassococcus sp. S3]
MTRKQDRSTIDLADWRKRIRPAIAERAEYRCESCGLFVGMHGDVDHKVPRHRCEAEGINPRDPENLQYLCKSCHSIKTNRERWDGHKRKDRQEVRRARVTGRGAFLQALQEGGA